MESLYQKYRPRRIGDVFGQAAAVASLETMIAKKKIPHAILFTGPSGVGKTTLARILKDEVDCYTQDFHELNCADFRGIDDIRNMRQHCKLPPLSGGSRVWLIDEAGKLTSDAQNAILKLLEDTPSHTYFFLATTDPQKLIRTIHTRCSEVKLVAMKDSELSDLLDDTIAEEGLDVGKAVVDEIVSAAEGSARKALVILEQIADLKTEDEQIKSIQSTTFNKDEAFKLAQLLMFGGSWQDICKALRAVENGESEGIRYMILGLARSCLIGSKDGKPPNPKLAGRAFMLLEVFNDETYTSKHFGLARMCYEAHTAK